MNGAIFYGSLTRIAPALREEFDTEELELEDWSNGDYVLLRARHHPRIPIETTTGRKVEILRDDLVLGALGRRDATLEAVGGYEDVRDPGRMTLLTGAGLTGAATSVSHWLPPLPEVEYLGHVTVEGRRVGMSDYRASGPEAPLEAPVVLTVGTSMSAGKTTTARFAIRALKRLGLRVVGAKLTGAGRYQDILAMRDAGADAVFDFVDAGLPSTVCGVDEYRGVLRPLLRIIGGARPDVVVIEAGASPLERYNGDTLIEELGDRVRCRFLAASDPYAVRGVQDGFGSEVDLVTGPAASTTAAVRLVERLTGLRAANVLEPDGRRALEETLARTLGLS